MIDNLALAVWTKDGRRLATARLLPDAPTCLSRLG